MSRLESLVFLWPRHVYRGSSKPILLQGVKASCNVVLPDRSGTSWHSHVSASVSKIILSGRRSTFAYSTLYPPQTTLHTQHSTHHTPHFALYTLHSTLYTPHFTLHTLHFTLHTLHCTLYTPHSTLYTPHFTLYTLHFTLHTPHFTLYTLHSTLCTPTPHYTLCTPHSKLYTPLFTLYTPHSTLYTPHCTLLTLKFTLHTLHCTLYTLHFTLYTPHSTLYTPHSTLCTPPSSAFHSLQCTGTVTGEKCRLFKWLVLRKHSTWLNSGSWAASFFYTSQKSTRHLEDWGNLPPLFELLDLFLLRMFGGSSRRHLAMGTSGKAWKSSYLRGK